MKIVWCGKPIPLGTTGAQITKAGTTRTTTGRYDNCFLSEFMKRKGKTFLE